VSAEAPAAAAAASDDDDDYDDDDRPPPADDGSESDRSAASSDDGARAPAAGAPSEAARAAASRRRAHAAALGVAGRLGAPSPACYAAAAREGRAKLPQHAGARELLLECGECVLSLALAEACVRGHARTAAALLEAGAVAERACAPRDGAAAWPCVGGDDAEAPGAPALHRAIAAGHDDVAKLLIRSGANANAAAAALGGATPLHTAALHNRAELARFLVARCNARLDAVDDGGKTAAARAAEMRWSRTERVLKDPSLLFWARATRANRLCKEGEHALALESYAQALAELCVEINQWNGRVQQNFKPLSLGHIEVDSADFWTNRSLSSSSRSRAEEVASKLSRTLTLKSG